MEVVSGMGGSKKPCISMQGYGVISRHPR
jgi:hypothetical protein